MAQSIAAALACVKQQPAIYLPSPQLIAQVTKDQQLVFRNTPLAPGRLIPLVLTQAAHGNASARQALTLAGIEVTEAAYCTAKKRLPVAALRELNARMCQQVIDEARGHHDPASWLSHRVYFVDGSSVSMPDTPELQKHFGQPGNQQQGCGFPVTSLMCLFQRGTGLLCEMAINPLRTGELDAVRSVQGALAKGDVLVGDTAFGAFMHMAMLRAKGVHYLFPVHHKRTVDFTLLRPHRLPGHNRKKNGRVLSGLPTSRWLISLGPRDQIVMYLKPRECPAWMDKAQHAAMPDELPVRECEFVLKRPGFRDKTIVICTSLLNPKVYPVTVLARLLGERWIAETNLRHMKTTLKMEVLRSQTVDGVKRELWAFALVYNAVRRVMLQAARQQGVESERVSFAAAWYWLRYAEVTDTVPRLRVNPVRASRTEPRAVKRRPKEYDRLNRSREALRKREMARR